MPTSFVSTTFVVLVSLNNYGALAPVDKALMPPGQSGPILWSVDQCNMIRGKMDSPEKYTCQVFHSAKSTAWTYTPLIHGCDIRGCGNNPEVAPPPENVQPDTNPEHSGLCTLEDNRTPCGNPEHSARDAGPGMDVGPTALKDEDRPFIEPRVVEPAPKTLPTKRVVRRRQPQFDPIGTIVSLSRREIGSVCGFPTTQLHSTSRASPRALASASSCLRCGRL